MRAYVLLAFTILMCGSVNPIASAATVAQLNQNDPNTWLVKSVCTDAQNQIVQSDPYYGCPQNIRKIASGDPLPYHNVEQIGYQQRDVFPVQDPLSGQAWDVATYDYQPFNYFNLYDGTDGYDVITLQSGWANIVNTSDGGGYGQTFFGSNCTVGGAWVLFPQSGFLSGGQATVPIGDSYWEQGGQYYPGSCPSSFSTTTLTSWKYQRNFTFGGINGNPTKTMNTIISYHGFQSGTNFLRHGHLEVFYFTREYGLTRWETWTPVLQNPTPTSECVVPTYQRYQRVMFVVQSCHDWSNISTPLPTMPQVPIWPIPNLNVLGNPHFTDASVWQASGPISWTPEISKASRDTAFSPIGVAYAGLGCGSACSSDFSVSLFQDVPASRLARSQPYAFGINVRTDPNGCAAPCGGTVAVAVQQFDAGGNLLSQTPASAPVTSDNGTAPSQGEAQSVYLSTAFVSGTITVDPNTATVRFLISPQTGQTFDLLQAWLGPWPAPTAW